MTTTAPSASVVPAERVICSVPVDPRTGVPLSRTRSAVDGDDTFSWSVDPAAGCRVLPDDEREPDRHLVADLPMGMAEIRERLVAVEARVAQLETPRARKGA